MAISWYLCGKCRTLIKKDSIPAAFGCSDGHHHTWLKLGEVGDTNYQCRKCGMTVQCKSIPSPAGCSDGHHHTWQKL